jgi:hypothetical protein
MNKNTVVFTALLVGSFFLTSTSFAAYWWWWGWSSISSSSFKNTTLLTRDVCTNWDYSNSYYDGTCGNKPTAISNEQVTLPTSFATQAVKKPTPFIFKTETKNKLKEKIVEQQKIKKQDMKVPIKYILVQKKIDKIMMPRELLSREERLKKAVSLFEKTELLLEKESLSPKIETIIVYLQSKVIGMIQNAWSL